MVYYFSGTGNSKYVAKRIAKAIGEKVINIVEYVNEENLVFELSEDTNIGIVFPTYYFGMPLIIEKFFEVLEMLNISNSNLNFKYIYIVYTYEASGAGIEYKILKSLSEKNIDLKYINSVKMPNNFSIYYNLGSLEEEKVILEKAEVNIDKIIENIRNQNIKKPNYNIVKKIVSIVMYPVYKHGRNTRRFYADDKCINCSLCEKVCPSNAIIMQDKKPKWIKPKCEYCLACYNRCPVDSIQIGGWTINRRRYYNPKVESLEND